MERRCPDCGMPTEGAEVCPSCGAFDFTGLTSWVCFACGAQNAHDQAKCGCGHERVVECAACGAEVPFNARQCPTCQTERGLFEVAKQAKAQSEQVQHLRRTSRSLLWRVAPLAGLGLGLLLAGSMPLRMAGAGLVGLAAIGAIFALVTARQARRRMN